MEYKVSVIVPVYNCDKYLETALNSVLNQPDFSDLQLILVDDGSTDSSGEICDKYKKYKNVSVIHQKNSGVSAARNAGLKAAKGEWIAFLDSDDRLMEGIYDKMLKLSDADIVCCEYSSNVKREDPLNKYFKKDFIVKSEFSDSLYTAMFDGPHLFQCWNKIYKRNIIEKYNISFPVGVKYAEDMIFVFTYLKYAESFGFVDEPLYYYFVNDNNATSYVNNAFEVNRFIYDWQKKNYKDYPEDKNKNRKYISTNFVFRNVLAVSSAAYFLPFFNAVSEVSKIIKDDLFYKAYLYDNYNEFVCTYDKYLNRFIRQQSAVKIVIWAKLFKLRSLIKR